MKTFLLTTCLLAGLSCSIHAQILLERASTQFTDYLAGRSYEGDVLPQNNTAAPFVRRVTGTITSESVAGGYLTFQKPSTATLSYQVGNLITGGTSAATWWTDNADPAKGFTVEFRVQAIEGYSFNFIGSYNNSDATQVLYIHGSEVKWGGDTVSTAVNSDTFHVFRLVNLPGSTTYQLWRDDVLISSSLAGTLTTAPNRFWFGNWGGTAGGGVLDYLRWDTSGAYRPVPEPSTFAALAIGLVLCGGRFLRRRNASPVKKI